MDTQYNMFTLPSCIILSLITPKHRCDTYGNKEMGWRFYPGKMLDDVKFIEASNWTYISVDFIRLFNSDFIVHYLLFLSLLEIIIISFLIQNFIVHYLLFLFSFLSGFNYVQFVLECTNLSTCMHGFLSREVQNRTIRAFAALRGTKNLCKWRFMTTGLVRRFWWTIQAPKMTV